MNDAKQYEKYKFIVDVKNVNRRLDTFLTNRITDIIPSISRNKIKTLIEDGSTLINDQVKKDPSYKIKISDNILINIPTISTSSNILPENIPLDIIFEDEYLLVINKQAGLATHPGLGLNSGTLVNALLNYCPDTLSDINGEERPGILHRLDKGTTGLMVVAKNNKVHEILAAQIQNREFKREYAAVAWGVVKPLQGIINKNIDHSKFNYFKMAIVKTGGRFAITNYKVKDIYGGNFACLVECKLDTGRTHQIRVHFSSIGNPLIGDELYGSNKKRSLSLIDKKIKEVILNFKRPALHSQKISFIHPISGKLMDFEKPMPQDMKLLISSLKKL